MERFRINAELYAAVIVAKRDINWDEYLNRPKKKLAIGYTIYPPKQEESNLLSMEALKKKLGVATIKQDWDKVREIIGDMENHKAEVPITKLRVVA